ncbi:type I methionyl aminopeptidase [bacterium]|nr:type I methionyl aminopeptidase [bacterium]MBU1024399.1 type I methionyl aminopeptidase [bacterium]
MLKNEEFCVDLIELNYDKIAIMPTIIKNKHQIQGIKKSCLLLNKVMERIKNDIKSGITSRGIDRKAENMILKFGATPAFKGVYGPPPYPATLCISINEEIVHGIPSKRTFKKNDLVSIDCGLIYHGFYSDAAFSVVLDEETEKQDNLMKATRWSMFDGIDQAVAGNTVGHISHAIQTRVQSLGCDVVKVLFGHGVGLALHEDPPIYNYGKPGDGITLKPGMVLAIETMVVAGKDKVKTLDDGWTVVTADGQDACHFEETVLVTNDAPEILTNVNEDDRP